MLTGVKASLTKERVAKLKEEDAEKYGFLPDEGIEVEVQYDFGDNLADAASKFSEEIILNMFQGHVKFGLQSMIRNKLEQGLSQSEIQAEIFNVDTGEYVYKPSKTVRLSEEEKIKRDLSKKSPEERAAAKERLLKMLDEVD